MVQQLLIGRHSGFSSSGIFLSQPGDNVLSPTKALIVDSRYQNVSVHQQGRIRMSKFTESDNVAIWYATVTWPALGYTPLYYASMRYASANDLNIPINSDYYPSNDCATWDTDIYSSLRWGIWLEGSNTMRAKVYAGTGQLDNVDFDLSYIICKRAL